MPTLNPYLTFNNNCREAMSFYQSIFGGEVTLMPVKDTPVCDQVPASMQDSILHSELKTENFSIMGSDMAPEAMNDGNTNHMSIGCKTEKQTRDVFEKLSAGGRVTQPLNKMFFGWIGSLEDKFNKRWIVVCNESRN